MKKKILIAPLNWGLGHATRCIPIIDALVQHNFIPVLASDGAALSLLTKEFPDLEALELPSYNITYPKKGYLLKLKLFRDSPKIIKTIHEEQRAIQSIVKRHTIDGIISDNRFGVYHNQLPSVFITHQLKVLSGNTTWLSTKLHQKTIKRFDQCWIPDVLGPPNLSGMMGHIENPAFNIEYIGPLSRFEKKPCEAVYDVMVLLSGPEPQREILEKKLLEEFKNYRGKILFVRGVLEDKQSIQAIGNLTLYNFMTTELLETSLNSSSLVIARSGYTTIMDLAKLGKHAFFIPTPGQFEQIYLAKRMQENNMAPFCKQDDFSLDKLKDTSKFKGLKAFEETPNFKELFHLFEGE
ncbi:glycosyltransferase family protein [Gelidibacter sp.]|uniref:glycosyltransferase family protein n=1 Tax=Gelidibacter sp. TaxID=2018083 RepID=UPI002C0F3F6F|nr:glycosyltransferase family protein [Gelidibacter sp.]HUH29070.1 glycosyltransferase family protein [Gelidibacter sp.]